MRPAELRIDRAARALTELGISAADDGLVWLRTWELLSRLTVLMPTAEEPETPDWANTQNRPVPFGRGGDLCAARRLL